jgi:hypothetical protein
MENAMGNFSRDSFKETNVLNNLLGLVTPPVANARHYVGVRLQQGVPMLDADWNELEDIRRIELMALLRHFIGNGVPANNQGFRISTSNLPNNFEINPGVILVDGVLVINERLTTYSTQPQAAALALPPLSKPDADRSDLVYLDTWEDEINAVQGDPRLINNFIGVETAVRLERKWAVRVQPGNTDLAAVPKQPGHKYASLARLNRRATVAAITDDMILDLRKSGITLAENLKIPLFVQIGLDIVDLNRFAQMLKSLRTSLFARLRTNQLPHQTANVQNENILLIALQELLHRAQTGEISAASRNLDNQDGLRFMQGLYDAQKDFLSVLSSIGNVGNAANVTAFITDYTKRLDGSAVDNPPIKGLKLALTNQDLLATVMAQEEINIFLSAPVDNLPEGDIFAIYNSAIPFELMQADATYDFSFDLESRVTLPATQTEDFNIQVTISPSSWKAEPDRTSITLQNQGGRGTVKVRVTPKAIDNQATLTVIAIAARNPQLKSTQQPLTLQINQNPPVGAFFFYAGPRLDAQGQLNIPRTSIITGAGVAIRFALLNSSTNQTRTYGMSGQVAGSPAGWSVTPPTSITIPPNQPLNTFDVRIKAPATVPAGTTGTFSVTARLTQINGVNVVDGETVTIQIPFIVIGP